MIRCTRTFRPHRRGHLACCVSAIALLGLAGQTWALNLVRPEIHADQAASSYGVDGSGVVVVIIDRGIDWRHADFRKADGSTRILAMLDMSGQNLCASGNPAPVEYSQAQINAALGGGSALAERDAVGHGTATAGTAAGNGLTLSDQRYQGIAPKADVLIVKVLSEGAPAHDGQAAEAPFQACYDNALDWVKGKLDVLGKPAVVLINSGTQWGPIDGSSALSRKLAQVLPANQAGRIMVIPSGDEGNLANHAGADFNGSASTSISRAASTGTVMSGWYSGGAPASVTVSFSDGTSLGPVAAGASASSTDGSIILYNYAPGTEFYPWTSNAGYRALWIYVSGHAVSGTVAIRAQGSASGHLDLYGDVQGPNLTPVTSMSDHLVAGRLTDYAATPSVIVVGNYVDRTQWTDVDNVAQSLTTEGAVGALWLKSSPGPTRDGRSYGVDIAAPGQNLFAPVALNSYWATFRFNLPQGSAAYTRFGGTSGAAPIVVGAVALMLQARPTLTTRQARAMLRATARGDSFTASVPNTGWGYGKLDVYAAVGRARDTIFLDGLEQ